MQWAGPRGLLGPNMMSFGLAWDDPAVTPADKLRCDAPGETADTDLRADRVMSCPPDAPGIGNGQPVVPEADPPEADNRKGKVPEAPRFVA
jgi:hypothetical protein